jgi:lysophospholipase L1-like esterase
MQEVLTGSALVMCLWVGMPWGYAAAVAAVGVCLLAVSVAPRKAQQRANRWSLAAAWAFSLLVQAGLSWAGDRVVALDTYYAVVACLVGIAVLPTGGHLNSGPVKTGWKVLSMSWLLLGSCLWLAGSYVQNLSGPFHAGLLFILVLLIGCRWRFRPPALGIQIINTLLLLAVALPLVDLFIRPSYRLNTEPDTAKRYYSYAAAKQNPAAFGRWWNYYDDQMRELGREVFTADPTGVLPFRLKPNSRGYLFRSRISINSRGFRGKEIAEDKGEAFRIVTLGESTTFGCTLEPHDRPWPELLEQMIRERLKPGRPVEVINAGVPAFNLRHNLRRLPGEILPLKPDLIISYHGYNGRILLRANLPTVYGHGPPAYRQRPLKLLADVEYRIKMMRYRHRQTPQGCCDPLPFADPIASLYAQAYDQLIQWTKTNGIRLAVANFSMAVNGRSDPEVVEFYRAGFPSVRWDITANEAHSLLVEELARQHPGVCLVDTHKHLDGEHEKFIDLVHLTQAGRQQLAENMFAGIRDVLATALSVGQHPDLAEHR